MPEFSQGRATINKLLQGRIWFQNTDTIIAQRLINLPETYNGFLQDLSLRNDQLGLWQLIKVTQVFIPVHKNSYAIFIIFLIRNKNNETCHFQYVSWRHGPASGVKGIVLIKDANTNQYTHLVMLNAMKFGAGIITYDCIGGFAEENEVTDPDMIYRFRTEIKEELGLEELPPHQIIDLGRFHPDSGMTNNKPFVMAAILSSNFLPLLQQPGLPNPDKFESTTKIIIPISQLADLIKNCDDSFLHVCLTRLWAKGIVLFPNL